MPVTSTASAPAPIRRQTYSVAEAATILGISLRTAYTAIQKGDIRATRLLGRILIPAAEVNRLLGCERREAEGGGANADR